MAAQALGQFGQVAFHGVELLQHLTGVKDHGFASLGQPHTAGQSIEQDRAELLFHGFDTPTGCGQREVQSTSRLGDVLGIGDLAQQPKVGGVQMNGLHRLMVAVFGHSLRINRRIGLKNQNCGA